MLTALILPLLVAGATHTTAPDLQAPQCAGNTKSSSEMSLVAYGPVHGPDPDREIHDYGMATNNPDPYGGRTSNGSDIYGGRYGGTDPYSGKTGNNTDAFGGKGRY